LKTVTDSFVVDTDKNGKRDLRWQVRSAREGVVGTAHLYASPPVLKAVGTHGVLSLRFRDFPNKDVGLFVLDSKAMEPGSNALLVRKADFVAGDGDAAFRAALAKISGIHPPTQPQNRLSPNTGQPQSPPSADQLR
jgi:hypothetical protein